MNREEWMSLAIRVVGLYLWVVALLALPRVATAAYRMADVALLQINLREVATSGGDEAWGKMADLAWSLSSSELVAELARIVMNVGIGLYLLRGGKFVLRVVRWESRVSPEEGTSCD